MSEISKEAVEMARDLLVNVKKRDRELDQRLALVEEAGGQLGWLAFMCNPGLFEHADYRARQKSIVQARQAAGRDEGNRLI